MAFQQVFFVTVCAWIMWKFLQVSKTVWRLSSNTQTHKSMLFANISLCDYFSWKLIVDSSIMSIIFAVRDLTLRDLPDLAEDTATKI